MEGASARLAIACQFPGCVEVAATVELIPRGARYADGQPDLLHDLRISPTMGAGSFRLSGFLPYTGFSVMVRNYETTVASVLDAGDGAAAALHDIDETYAPFFCRECRRSYCGQHWNLRPVFDYGFDYYTGTCPSGHRHFIDH